ncbi:addiction module antidote protein, HigA family [Mesorhizobium sp. M2A.F.Ca.ET.042.01.1.1]|uniref:HigA family addiction module antitoxin n=1 Tax=Mesorhizobium sp. M2A.F.Ca.ET.042.01.1.1 TaxID=2496745 RepID=UPI000FCCD652|nr:HigA family addiction module antitoxin [Mesorhizobium sp. M2A.F.Ca.ET.042.01.1.1]RUX33566.1 addiction module antidote protein, HigA family [Mesorhizobium sp. M2A.F.Ca.ET.042.01.1.1]
MVKRSTSGKTEAPRHPGRYVREVALEPKALTVTEAAKLLDVSRPNVSNFLNGKAAATAEMAARIERAFKIPAQTLLDMQAAFDAAEAKSKGAQSSATAYVPPFLAFKRNDIEDWAVRNISARTRFSVFLRTLVNSTGIGLSKVDFPGNDDAESPGWDGYVETTEGTRWIPAGISGWEFGVSQDIKGKADGDFAKSVKALSKSERMTMTFVFVSPRAWPGKTKWTADAKSKGQWKGVRAYDAQDLEQWLEQSLAAQAWFANETHHPSEGVRSLDKCWADWASVTTPPLSATLFKSGIDAAKRTMLSRLTKEPDGPTIIAADSTGEALAMLSQLFGPSGGEELAAYRDQVLIFDAPGVLPRLAQSTQGFIAVVASRGAERELAPFARTLHTVVVYPRNAAVEPHIVLEPASDQTFRTALEEMGYSRDDIDRLDNESGRSLTVLRRRLSTVPAVRTPEWAEPNMAARLVPFLFVGAWNSANETDREALSLLSNDLSYETLEKECHHLAQLDDAPIWAIGTYRGVISKIDLLFAIAGSITTNDLDRYFSIARMVLGEDDPTLDLPESERWAASIHGKARDFSAAFREGFSETLVLLAVHGNTLFKGRLGKDLEFEAERLVHDLLPTPLTLRKLEANDRDLPTYAEAAPNAFLTIIERDLKSDNPVVLGLLRPVDSGVFGSHPSRTGLLWALEGLSWNPATLSRAARILARLAEVEINDNWINKPTHSLSAIFRAWMPQTAASLDERIGLMKILADTHPGVAWKICIEQLDTRGQMGDYSHKPRWRPDGYGYGEPIPTWGPINAFRREMLNMVLDWPNYSAKMLCDLVEHIHDLDDDSRVKVWDTVRLWAKDASDDDRAAVREKIRVTVMSRRGIRRAETTGRAVMTADAQAAYAELEPADLLNRHHWLFRDVWVQESADELEGEGFDYQKRDERIRQLRVAALREVFQERGITGIFELAERGNAAWQIGWLLATDLIPESDLPQVLLVAIRSMIKSESWTDKNLVSGALHAILDHEKRKILLRSLAEQLSREEAARLLLLAPFRRSTWELVDTLNQAEREHYWAEVAPGWIHDSDAENSEAIERLLAAERPRAAFSCVRYKPSKLQPSILYRILKAMAADSKDKPGQYQVEQYSIEEAFVALDRASEITLEQKAGLEFTYLDALARPRSSRQHGIVNLEKYIEDHPEMFVQAVVWAYKRRDGREDPQEFRVAPESLQHFAERGYKLLDALERIPGQDEPEERQAGKLAAWVKTVRDACAELGRGDIADICLGKLLSSAPVGSDGVWPCEPVRQLMEDIQSERISEGAHTGLYNARGVVWRGEGGNQERELAEKYRRWATALQYSHPFVASTLLMGMVRTYEHEASREDMEAGIRRRLR